MTKEGRLRYLRAVHYKKRGDEEVGRGQFGVAISTYVNIHTRIHTYIQIDR